MGDPQGLTGIWVQAEGGNGEETDAGTASGAGKRRGAQRRATEAEGWRVGATSRWTEICVGREFGERV